MKFRFLQGTSEPADVLNPAERVPAFQDVIELVQQFHSTFQLRKKFLQQIENAERQKGPQPHYMADPHHAEERIRSGVSRWVGRVEGGERMDRTRLCDKDPETQATGQQMGEWIG